MRILLINTLILFSLSTCAFSQNISVFDDFEGNGTIDSWFGDECIINTSFDNPYLSNINSSNTVLMYHDQGGQYANIRFDLPSNLDLTENRTFTLKIYVPSDSLTGNQANQISLKLQNADQNAPWSTQTEIIKPVELDTWQIVSFDFGNDPYINLENASLPPVERTDFNRVVLQVNGENNNDFVLAYIDDIIYDGTVEVGPVFDQLIWSDEFETDGPVNPDNWFHQTKLPNGFSWYNGEIQHYTDRIENTYVQDGMLHIEARREDFTDQGHTKAFTSARLNSKFAFKEGRVEIRAKLPTGRGTWPALWTLGKNINENGAYWYNEGFGTTSWPACGEIDIMEHWGSNQNYVSSATHTPSSFGGTINVGGQIIETVSDSFHIYELIWTEEKLVFSVDGNVHYTYNPPVKNSETWPYTEEQYLIFNVAILGEVENSFTSSSMDIDYVRIYKEGAVTNVENVNTRKKVVAYPIPFTDRLTIKLDEALDQSDIQITLTSLNGSVIKKITGTVQNTEILINDLNTLDKGVYIVQFTVGGELRQVTVCKL